MRLSAGSFVAGAGVQTDKTAEALREFFNELEAIRKPVGADELAKAKNYVALGFPSEFETIGDLASHRAVVQALHEVLEGPHVVGLGVGRALVRQEEGQQ